MLTDLDLELRSWVVTHRYGWLDPIFEGLTYIGSFGILWLILAAAISILSRSRPWLWLHVGVTILAAEAASGGLKLLLRRDRPAGADPLPLVDLPATYSLPSGHATVSFACATMLALAVPKLLAPLYALAALVAFSRVYVGVHYPSDIVAGAVLGIVLAIALRTLAAVLRRSGRALRAD